MIYPFLSVAAIGYLLGSVSFAVIISRMLGEDVRLRGSGNAGSTNMLRNYGAKAAALTFGGDFLKGALASCIALFLFQESEEARLAAGVAGVFALLGHMKPIFFGFKGGKGVATALGVLLVFSPIAFCVIAVIGVPFAWFSGYVSLAAVTCAAGYPFVMALADQLRTGAVDRPSVLIACILVSMIIFCHRENIKRLINGTESNIRKKK